MNKICLQNVRVVDSKSSWNGEIVNVLVENGKIAEISKQEFNSAEKIFDFKGKQISPAWIDFRTYVNTLGYEWKEDWQTLNSAAIHGGFVEIVAHPLTQPHINSPQNLTAIQEQAKNLDIEVHFVAEVSTSPKKNDMAELLEMHENGAIAFSEYYDGIQNSNFLVRVLQYLQAFDGLLIQRPEDFELAEKAMIHEGLVNLELGLRGIPDIAESSMLARDLSITNYLDTKIHFGPISAEKTVKILRSELSNEKISADIAVPYLLFTDENLHSFDSNYKVSPPFRAKNDKNALIQAVLDKKIKILSSAHLPQALDDKKVEFVKAEYGISGIETSFSIANSVLCKENKMPLDELLDCFTHNPRAVLGLENISIEEGSLAKFTIFDSEKEWTVTNESLKSKSKNTPLIGEKLIGKAEAVFLYNRLIQS